jgi:putative nucleotidyltransferase with HDIG domain
VAAAVAAQLIARKLGDEESPVFTATLLHDIGKIILAQAMDDVYARLFREAEINQISLVEAEKKLLGVDHAAVGGQLLERWKFPHSIVMAVTCHHSPAAAEGHQRLASYVYLGNMIAYFMGYGYGHLAFALRGRGEALAALGLAPESIPQFMTETFEQVHIIETFLSLAPEGGAAK